MKAIYLKFYTIKMRAPDRSTIDIDYPLVF
jgi:hypothetical protein